VLELATHAASLEDAFLELTEGAEEYQSHTNAKADKADKTGKTGAEV
jgi:hypothetical protein